MALRELIFGVAFKSCISFMMFCCYQSMRVNQTHTWHYLSEAAL